MIVKVNGSDQKPHDICLFFLIHKITQSSGPCLTYADRSFPLAI